MSASNGTRDHWNESLDAVEALMERLEGVSQPPGDTLARRLMAQIALAKASSFIALLEAEGRVLDVNPAPLIGGGVERGAVIGRPLWETPWWQADPQAAAHLEQAIARAAEGRFVRYDVDVLIEGGGRSLGTLDLSLRPLRARTGAVALIVAEGRVITDRKQAEQRIARQNAELSALTDRLARIHDYRERLLGNVSHDLRAPLRATLARADRILRACDDEDVRQEVRGIQLAAVDALEQVDDMLEQVRRDHGETPLVLVDADLSRVVRGVAAHFEALAAERGLTFDVSVPPAVAARFDVERLSRIVSNLLANAIRFAPAGGWVRCTLSAAAGLARLEVADNGAGVPHDQRDTLFGRFRTADREHGPGAGLGLAIVREFAALHGGTVTAGDGPEGGALFVVTLPTQQTGTETAPATLAQQAAAAQRTAYVRAKLAAELQHDPLETSRMPARVPTVLIVERIADRAATLAQEVGEAAVACIASDGVEAVRLALELEPAAVVVGTSTGEMTPIAILGRLAHEERLGGATRIAVVGEREGDAPAEHLLAAGADEVLPAADAVAQLGRRLARRLGSVATRP